MITLTMQMRRTSPKYVTPYISRWKKTLSKKLDLHLHFWQKFHHVQCFWWKTFFLFKLTIRKLMAKAFQNTLVLYQYVFNSRSNLCTNLVHWNSLHPKKAILPTVLGQTPCFHSENHIPRTNNLHHRKAGTLAVILA